MDDRGLSYDEINNIVNKRDEEEKKDRRQKIDWVSRMATILSVLAWLVMIAVWVVVDTASPDRGMRFTQTFFDVHFGVDASTGQRTNWNNNLIFIAFVLQIVSIGTCLIAFLFNKMRMKRKSDKYKMSIFIIGGITIVAFIAFIIRFWSSLLY